MSNLQVLVATMHQKDFSLLNSMNMHTDAIIINQCGYEKFDCCEYKNHAIKMFSMDEVGLSKSRNEALLRANGDICLIADDDITYVENYDELVLDAFRQLPDADIIVFNTDMKNTENGPPRKYIQTVRRAPRYKSYGSVRIAFRRNSFIKNNIWFNINFGAGGKYCCGEESLMLRDANRKRLKIYEHPAIIASVDYGVSTWFKGCNEEYFYNKGAYAAEAYKFVGCIFKWYMVLRLHQFTELSYSQCVQNMNAGAAGYKKLQSYEDYFEKEKAL